MHESPYLKKFRGLYSGKQVLGILTLSHLLVFEGGGRWTRILAYIEKRYYRQDLDVQMHITQQYSTVWPTAESQKQETIYLSWTQRSFGGKYEVPDRRYPPPYLRTGTTHFTASPAHLTNWHEQPPCGGQKDMDILADYTTPLTYAQYILMVNPYKVLYFS